MAAGINRLNSMKCYTFDTSDSDIGTANWSCDLQPCPISETTPTNYLTNHTHMLRVQANFDLIVSTDKGEIERLVKQDSPLHRPKLMFRDQSVHNVGHHHRGLVPIPGKADSKAVLSLTRRLESSSLALYLPSHQRLLGTLDSKPNLGSLGDALKTGPHFPTPISVEVLVDTSSSNEATPIAPILHLSPVVGGAARVSAPLDVVGVFPEGQSVCDVTTAVKSGLAAQLKEVEEAVFWKVCVCA